MRNSFHLAVYMTGSCWQYAKALECYPSHEQEGGPSENNALLNSAQQIIGCHRPVYNQYEAVASPSMELHHHISSLMSRFLRISKRESINQMDQHY